MSDLTEAHSPGSNGVDVGGDGTADAKPRTISRRLAAIIVAIALVGGGTGAAIALSSVSSGAQDPASAVDNLLSAADHSDALGVLDAIAPGERQAIEPGFSDLVNQLERLGVLSQGTNLSDIAGLTLHFSKVALTTRTLTPDLVAVSITGGTVTETVDPAKFPIGTFVDQFAPSVIRGAVRSETAPVRTGSSAIVTEDVNGSWHVSLGYTIVYDALRAKGESGIPQDLAGEIHPTGAASADDAVRAFIDNSAAFNLSGLIGDLAPGEMGALQTYAPEILGRAESALGNEQSKIHLKVTGMNLSDSAVNGGTLVKVSDLGLSASIGAITITIKNGCVSETTVAGTTSHCPSPASKSAEARRVLAVLPSSLRPLATRLLTTHPAIGIVALDEGGGWYLSPVATALDDIDAYLSILQPQDLVAIGDLARNPAEARALARSLEAIATSGLTSGSGLL